MDDLVQMSAVLYTYIVIATGPKLKYRQAMVKAIMSFNL